MSIKKVTPILRGVTTVFASLFVISSVGSTIANTFRSQVDAALGTQSFIVDTENLQYKSVYETEAELEEATKKFAVKQGEEGTVVMKNDNKALPMAGKSVALFGGAAYKPYTTGGGNSDKVDLVKALENAGYTIDPTVKGIYDKLFSVTVAGVDQSGRPTETPLYSPNTSAGDYVDFKIVEASADKFVTEGEAAANWESLVEADTAIVVFSRPGGEGTTYKPGSALNTAGEATGKSPLELSEEELSVVKAAKAACDKVVVLLNVATTLSIDPLTVKGGEFEADAICYIGVPSDYQFTGIVNVLKGEVNATGALADTYAASSMSAPAMMNFGGGYFSDYNLVLDFEDTRWPGANISNDKTGSFGGDSYNGGHYMVQAEGIYTGYYYYETRYYDSVANPSYNAASTAGVYASKTNWNYDEEVSYTFGHGLSYLDYDQEVVNVEVENRNNGNVTATVKVTNNSNKDGYFLAQLYVQQPYTQYDKTNLVEKSAIMFLNAKKVEVKAGESEEVEITIPTKYLASYDYTGAKTYILDGGNYYFTAAAGAHEAVNNVLAAQGKTTANGMDANGNADAVVVETVGTEGVTDTTTYSVSGSTGTKITNVADNADINYYLPGAVTYLSRQNWSGTWPINYNDLNGDGQEDGLTIADSAKKDEWLKEMRNQQYTINENGKVENPDGKKLDKIAFGYINAVRNEDGSINAEASTQIGYDQLTNINDPYWAELVAAISANEAVGAVAHGGSRSDALSNIDNPVVIQNDGPTGFGNGKLENGFKTAVNAPTLLGSSFNPELAREWGELLGNHGLWCELYQIWGIGLNYHRMPFNGRNVEYLSEDPMLSNVLGAANIAGTRAFGIISGPKHIGFNDQEHNRAGVSVYMNEQKLRETDLRGFQGAVEEGGALGLMVAFNRIGAINASHHVGMIKNMWRGEWGFNGLISTDMMNNAYYFNAEGCIMATITQIADFASGDSYINNKGDKTAGDKTWTYVTIEKVEKDATLVNQARENLKYQLYAFANSAIVNIATIKVQPWWETMLNTLTVVTGAISAAAALVFVGTLLINASEEE